MKKQIITLLCAVFCLSAFARGTLAQNLATDEVGTYFSKALYRESFDKKSLVDYDRFPKDVWYFDNLGLSYVNWELVRAVNWETIPNDFYYYYFNPVETLNADEWALLGRWPAGGVYKQSIALDEPYEKDVIHGMDLPGVSYLEDFYFYIDLFVTDNYPENTGSAYVYFSNSVTLGVKDSSGLLIDPRSGIYRAYNNYDSLMNIQNDSGRSGLYMIGSEVHRLELLEELDPSLYEGKTGSIGSSFLPETENLDGKFETDYEALKLAAETDGSSGAPSAYRIELVRVDGVLDLYINGIYVTTVEDGVIHDGKTYYSFTGEQKHEINRINVSNMAVDSSFEFEGKTISRLNDNVYVLYAPSTINRLVSWTYGPILRAGGENVTCAVGDIVINTAEKIAK